MTDLLGQDTPRKAASGQDSQDRRSELRQGRGLDQLTGAIETGVIPRLLMAHRQSQLPHRSEQAAASQAAPLSDMAVDTLTGMVLNADAHCAFEYVDGLRHSGVSLDRLFVDLLSKVARRLGEMWEQDLCDFTQVTVGSGQLVYVARALARSAQADGQPWQESRRGMLITPEREQHRLGLSMVSELLRCHSWHIRSETNCSLDQLCEAISQDSYAFLGISSAAQDDLGWIREAVAAIRTHSLNPDILILVGGPAFLSDSDNIAYVNADDTAADAVALSSLLERRFPVSRPSVN